MTSISKMKSGSVLELVEEFKSKMTFTAYTVTDCKGCYEIQIHQKTVKEGGAVTIREGTVEFKSITLTRRFLRDMKRKLYVTKAKAR